MAVVVTVGHTSGDEPCASPSHRACFHSYMPERSLLGHAGLRSTDEAPRPAQDGFLAYPLVN